MRLFTLFLLATLVTTSVDAAWYLKIGGTIVDPIRYNIYAPQVDLHYGHPNLSLRGERSVHYSLALYGERKISGN